MLLGKRFILSAKACAADLRVLLEQISRATERGPKCRRKSPKARVKRPGQTRRLSAAAFGTAAAAENGSARQPARTHEPGALPAPAVLQMDHSQAPNTLPVFGGLAAPAVCRAGWKRTPRTRPQQPNCPVAVVRDPHGAGSGEGPSGANLLPACPSPRAGLGGEQSKELVTG